MTNFKELLEEFPSNGLDNLGEKMRLEYDDTIIAMEDEPFDKETMAVIDDLVEKVSNKKFDENDSDNFHHFIHCEEELPKNLGFERITVCPYKGYESEPIESNFIYTDTPEHGSGKHLTIDIYNVCEKGKDDIRLDIIQELTNFVRDAQWAIDGVYEERMEEMKHMFHYNPNDWFEVLEDELPFEK